jgi:tetratricopeptide (TPR) repeat protein
VLYLDADERMQTRQFDNIKNKLRTAENDLGALICLIESKHGNISGGNEVHRGGYPRLFRNLGYPRVCFTGRVHEQISPSLVDAGYGMTKSNIVIDHIGYDISRSELEKKLKRNYRLLLQHVREEPTNGYAWYQLGQTLGQMKLRDKAEEAILHAMECGNLSNSVYASASATLSQFAGQRKDFQTALKWANESLKAAPEQVYGLNLKAQSLLLLGRRAEAKELFEKSLELLNAKKSVPSAGYDVMISEEEIRKGILKAS